MKISFCIITLNEADNLPRCLRSLEGLADEIVLVDSGSTDHTLEIARQFNCRCHHQDWLGYVGQKNKAISLASHEWIFSLDADEELSDELRQEILALKRQEPKPSAFSVPRCVCYEGQWIRHGLWYPDRLVRLFRKSQARFVGGKVHERLEITGTIEALRGQIHHYSFRDAADHWARCQKYARLWAETRFESGRTCGLFAPALHAAHAWVRGILLKRGFLDGALGWRIALFHSREVFLKYKLLRQMNHSGERRPLRIVHLNTNFRGGGVDNQTLELAAGLLELGQQVWLAVIPGRKYEPLALRENIPLFFLPEKKKLQLLWQLTRFLRREHIDLIHAHHGRDYWTAIVAARLSCQGTRVVISRHLATPPRSVSRWTLLRFCNAFVSVSEYVDQLLRRCMKGNLAKIRLLYGGVNTRAFASVAPAEVQAFRSQHGWDAQHVVCAVVGSYGLPKGKGQLEFLEAARRLKTEFPSARFALVGAGNMAKLLQETIRQSELNEIVTMVPFSCDMPLVMNAIDVLVHPAVGTEALGLVLWEAMASGKPVIASRLGGIPEAFMENTHGLLAPPGDVDALVVGMRSLLKDPQLRQKFGDSGREHVMKNFSRTASATRLLALYSEILRR